MMSITEQDLYCAGFEQDLYCAGFRIFLAANSLVLCYYLGPKRSTTVALSCALACAAGKAAQVLATSKKVCYRHSGLCKLLKHNPASSHCNPVTAW